MATISSLVSSLTSNVSQQSASSSSAQSLSALSNPSARTTKQTEKQAESARVKLSAVGQVASGLSNVRDSAAALQDKTKTGTAADASKAVAGFVKAFNDQNTNVSKATAQASGSQQAGSLANDSRVKSGSADVNRAAVGDSKDQAALSAAGISVDSSGALKFDSKKFEQAYKANPDGVQDLVAKLGKRTETAANSQLSSKGAIGTAQNNAKVVASAYDTKQSAQQAQAVAAQKAIEATQQSSSSAVAGLVASQVASYQKVFSL